MNMPLVLVVVTVVILGVHGKTIGSESLMHCSKFHFEEKVLEKLVNLEFKMKNHEQMIEAWTIDLKMGLEKIESIKQSTEQFVKVQKSDLEKTKENYLQWIEKEIKNLSNKTSDRMVSFDKVIKEKLVEIDDSETDKNRKLDVMRQELKSSTDTLYHNISDIMIKQTRLMEDFKGIQQRPSVAFAAYLTSKTSGGTDIVKFNDIWTNRGKAYDPNTGVFTAPNDGLYSFTAVLLSESGKSLYRHIWRNTEYLVGTYVNGNHGHKTGTVSVVLNLNKSDEVYIKARNAYYGGVYSGSDDKYSTFTGFSIT